MENDQPLVSTAMLLVKETLAPSGWKVGRVSKHVRCWVKVNYFHCPEPNLIMQPVILHHTSSDTASNAVASCGYET
jgi:hypothetical protein